MTASTDKIDRIAIRGPTWTAYWINIHPEMPEKMAKDSAKGGRCTTSPSSGTRKDRTTSGVASGGLSTVQVSPSLLLRSKRCLRPTLRSITLPSSERRTICERESSSCSSSPNQTPKQGFTAARPHGISEGEHGEVQVTAENEFVDALPRDDMGKEPILTLAFRRIEAGLSLLIMKPTRNGTPADTVLASRPLRCSHILSFQLSYASRRPRRLNRTVPSRVPVPDP